MTNRTGGRPLRRLPLLIASAGLLALTACGDVGDVGPTPAETFVTDPATPSASPGDDASEARAERPAMSSVDLIVVETSGGLCPDSSGHGTECESTTTIAGDGAWVFADQTGETRSGTLGSEHLTNLIEVLHTTDATKHPKPEPSCASWFDGRDVTLTYPSVTGKDVTVSSCDYDLSGVELLRVVERLTAA